MPGLNLRAACTVQLLGALLLCTLATGCSGPAELEDVTGQSPHRALVGSQFVVEGSVILHGVIDLSQGDQSIDWYSVFPAPGIGGTEVVSSTTLAKGTTFTVQRVVQRKSLFGGPVLLQISFDDAPPLQPTAPVYIGLYGGNEGKESALNPAQYRRKS